MNINPYIQQIRTKNRKMRYDILLHYDMNTEITGSPVLVWFTDHAN